MADLIKKLTINESADSIGYKQGTGAATLSSSVNNYQFLFASVGYYASGKPSYGSLVIPVNQIIFGSSADLGYVISCTGGQTVNIGFDNETTLRVHNTFDSNRYVTITGIKLSI